MIDRWTSSSDPRPFTGQASVSIVLATAGDTDQASGVRTLNALLISERFELEVELGTYPRFDNELPSRPDPPRCLIGPSSLNPFLERELRALGIPATTRPFVWIDRARHLVLIDGPDVAGVTDAFQILRTAIRSGNVLTVPHTLGSPEAVIDHVREEVATTYPAFALRGLDWSSILDRHVDDIRESRASLRSLQELFAELQDPHTWVRSSHTNARLPYRALAIGDRLRLSHVPMWSFGWRFGARAGDELLASNVESWRRRTPASDRARPQAIPYRMLAGTFGRARRMRARKPDGRIVHWVETYQTLPWRTPISADRLLSGTGYLRIRGWLGNDRWEEELDNALNDLRACPRLLVDLRGNVGGSLVAAQGFRDRFLTGRTQLGSIAFARGDGTLSHREPIIGEPHEGNRWDRPVRFLVDRQCYSATEDALLGLQGLPHVQLVGEPTGGGSGRPRTLRLTDRLSATISTALTYDRHGTCIEGQGLPVDLALPIETSMMDPDRLPSHAIISLADSGW